MSLISDGLAAIKLAVELLTKRDPRRQEVADIIEHIATTVEGIVNEYLSGAGISPIKFSEFCYYCEEFGCIAEDVLKPETISRIQSFLRFARRADERVYLHTEAYLTIKRDQALTGNNTAMVLLGKIKGEAIPTSSLQSTLEVAGQLRAIAKAMKVSKNKL